MSWLNPNVDGVILTVAGECKVAEEAKHWIVFIRPGARLLAGLAGIITARIHHGAGLLFWVVLLLGLIVIAQAAWRIVEERRDRFVITNQRIFRVWGVLNIQRASIPLLRILDITVNHPASGRWLNYGHFVFESAAQVQGLNEITYVPRIDDVEGVLRMVMQAQQQPNPGSG